MIVDDALRHMRSLASDIVRYHDRFSPDTSDTEDAASRLCNIFIALDEWLSNGGARPTSWQNTDTDKVSSNG